MNWNADFSHCVDFWHYELWWQENENNRWTQIASLALHLQTLRVAHKHHSKPSLRSRTWVKQAGWSGSCGAAAAGSGSAAAGLLLLEQPGVVGVHLRLILSPLLIWRNVLVVLQLLHPGLGVSLHFCYGVCHLDSWDGFAIFEKQTEHFKRKQSILLCAYLI